MTKLTIKEQLEAAIKSVTQSNHVVEPFADKFRKAYKIINAAESDLRNYLSQCFGNVTFVSQIQMKWEEEEGRLILRIVIPKYNGDILLVGQTEAYYRNGSNTTRLKGTELINIIRNYNS